MPSASSPVSGPQGAIHLFGKALPNRLGLAAGFDKDAEAVPALAALGFAAVEVGSVTPLPQPGNPRPRVFRLPADAAVVNRYGFNSGGHDRVRRNLDRLRPEQRPALLGVNLGANKTSENVPQDFALGVSQFADIADYLVINVSSPNTPGLRDHQTIDALARILDLALDARAQGPATPILLKIAPDLADEDVTAIVDLSIERGIDGLIATNTTIQRPAGLKGAAQQKAAVCPVSRCSTSPTACSPTSGSRPTTASWSLEPAGSAPRPRLKKSAATARIWCSSTPA